jgi:hypothetical protein
VGVVSVRIERALEPLLVPLDSVRQHEDNPNNGDLDAIIESIRVNGFYQPIIVNEAGQIIAGNHRWQAMHALGATHIPAITVSGDREADVRRMLADNKITRNGWDDDAKVLGLMKELLDGDSQVGLGGSGWVEEEMLRIVNEQATPLSFGSSTRVTISVTCREIDSARDLAAELIERGYDVSGVEV